MYEHRYFTAYQQFVADDPDLVVHVGDYIVWDDHEVDNDYGGYVSEEADAARCMLARRAPSGDEGTVAIVLRVGVVGRVRDSRVRRSGGFARRQCELQA